MTDTQRIDWLEQNHPHLRRVESIHAYWWECEPTIMPFNPKSRGRTIREVIDRAILQDQIDLAHEEGKLHTEMELKKELQKLHQL